jgi:hypothetical protein
LVSFIKKTKMGEGSANRAIWYTLVNADGTKVANTFKVKLPGTNDVADFCKQVKADNDTPNLLAAFSAIELTVFKDENTLTIAGMILQ